MRRRVFVPCHRTTPRATAGATFQTGHTPQVANMKEGERMGSTSRFRGHQLNWIDDDRSGIPRLDIFGFGHVLNPYYFTEDGAWCACRQCEPLIWRLYPPPSWYEEKPSEGILRAERRFLGFDPEARVMSLNDEFTPLW
jgi:hypothetical protein